MQRLLLDVNFYPKHNHHQLRNWYFPWRNRNLFSGFAISIFFLSLVIMNYISQMVLEDGKEKVKNLKENAKDNKDDIEQLEMKLKELGKLPVADRVAMFFPERIGILDRHEIRRA